VANNGRYRTEHPDLLDKIRELEQRIQRLERTPQTANAGVATNGILIRGGSLDVSRPDPIEGILDSFIRTTTNGWGITENGMPYDIVNGSLSTFSTDRVNGIMSIATVNSVQRALITFATRQHFDLTIQCQLMVTPVGGFIKERIDLRWADANNRVQVDLDIQTDNSIVVTISQVVAGTPTTLATGTLPGFVNDPTVANNIRLSVIGRAVKIKIWKVTNTQPVTWDFTGSILDNILAFQTTGAIGFAGFLQSTVSNTLPVVMKWGNLVVSTPHYVEDSQSEGTIQVGSQLSMNGEEGMAVILYRSNSVAGAYIDASTGLPFSGHQSLIVGTVDGSAVDPTFAFPTVTVSDKSGDPLITDSYTARRGFGEPKLSYAFNNNTYATSTSGTFALIMNCEWYMYHPHFRIRVLVQNDASNASELRVGESGGSANLLTQAVGVGAFQYVDLVVKRSSMVNGNSPNGNPAIVTLEHRRTSGAGTIRSMVLSCIGIDLSPSLPY